jgi:hypothetical protein
VDSIRQLRVLRSKQNYISARKFLGGHLRARPWVEPIAPGISQQVERRNYGHYGQCRKDHHVRRIEEVATRIIQNRFPTLYRRKHAEAEEAERASRVDRAMALRYE